MKLFLTVCLVQVGEGWQTNGRTELHTIMKVRCFYNGNESALILFSEAREVFGEHRCLLDQSSFFSNTTDSLKAWLCVCWCVIFTACFWLWVGVFLWLFSIWVCVCVLALYVLISRQSPSVLMVVLCFIHAIQLSQGPEPGPPVTQEVIIHIGPTGGTLQRAETPG